MRICLFCPDWSQILCHREATPCNGRSPYHRSSETLSHCLPSWQPEKKPAISINSMEIKSACPLDMNHKYPDPCVIILSRQRICRFPSVTWKWTGCSFCRLAVLQMQNLKMAVLWYKNLTGNSWHQLTDLCIRQGFFFFIQVFASSPLYHHTRVQCSRQSI